MQAVKALVSLHKKTCKSIPSMQMFKQVSHRLEKHLNLEGFLEKSLKIKYALQSAGKSCKGLEKSLNFSIFCRNITLLIEI